jgi:hypothetical protein
MTAPGLRRAIHGAEWGKTLSVPGRGGAGLAQPAGRASSARRPPIGAVPNVSTPP